MFCGLISHHNLLVSPFFISGLDKLEPLQSHENEEIYKSVYDIIDTYFTTAVSQISTFSSFFYVINILRDSQIFVKENATGPLLKNWTLY